MQFVCIIKSMYQYGVPGIKSLDLETKTGLWGAIQAWENLCIQLAVNFFQNFYLFSGRFFYTLQHIKFFCYGNILPILTFKIVK